MAYKTVRTQPQNNYNTLPCGYIVSKLDKSVSDNCVLCKEKHDLVHLLFTCAFAKEAWKLVSNFIKFAINLSDIVFGHKLSCHENYIISFATFCIFKFWILGKKNTITVNIHNFEIFLKPELLYKSEVLKQTKNQNTFKELLSLSKSIV